MQCPLQTDRLRLRMWTAGDYPAYAAFYDQPEVTRFVGGQKDAEDAWRHLAMQLGHWKLRGFGYYAVEKKATRDFVGCVGVWQSAAWPETELGYWVVPSAQGKGLALEAASAVLNEAKTAPEITSLVSYIDPSNGPSIRLAERLGAIEDGSIELASFGQHLVFRHF
ncbi:MAG: GNAT family acetyltransferase [Lysobacteraceae bacterium]|nr:MAG: GNAT family acetyltransferase [Xanthomonadaceae bacterium]